MFSERLIYIVESRSFEFFNIFELYVLVYTCNPIGADKIFTFKNKASYT